MKKALCRLLAAVMAVSSLTVAMAAGNSAVAVGAQGVGDSHYFYDQLNGRAQKIYGALYSAYENGELADGKSGVDLAANGAVTQAELGNYLAGDTSLSDDYSAAKDAFDLDHSEAWYIDSSYLTLRVGKLENGEYSAVLGIGRSDNYYVSGVSGAADVQAKNEALNAVIDEIIDGANAVNTEGYNESDAAAAKVQYVHDQVTKRISYRFENECKPENVGYIRTLYALVTHEGVCESYSRAMQVILTRLGIPCVLIHGIQNSGNAPEMHMWNAVNIGGRWFAVDATWDDPVRLDKDGNPKVIDGSGNDGGENDTYLLVGMDVIGANWLPSGVVSTGNAEFSYPEIEDRSFDGENVYTDAVGLHVQYTAMADMEGAEAGQWTIDYNGMGMKKAAEQGFYLILKMYDEHPDGTSHYMEDWYYAAASLAILEMGGSNGFFYDTDDYLKMYTATCEYVEFALTTRRPDGIETWYNPPASNGLSQDPETGWYHGDGSDIIAQTGLLYNMNSSYEAAPYVSKQYPDPTQTNNTGQTYRMHIEFDDRLYHPAVQGEDAPAAISMAGSGAPETEDMKNAANQNVGVKYTCYQQDRDGETVEYELVGEVNFDTDCDNFVDGDEITWLYKCDNDDPNHVHSPEDCYIYGVEFDYRASTNWSDDTTLYDFELTGLVGSRSNRFANHFSYVMSTAMCPYAYRSQGIDWALWGRPSLLDNPNDLDLSKMSVEGVDGSKESLDELQKQMKIDDMNGKLMLVVEEIGTEDGMSREKYREVTDAFDEFTDIDESAVKSSSMYEINFTRLCKMTVAMEGESIRLQVGFPKGYDAEDAANNTVVFKAYHFTRCSANHPCGNEDKQGHKYGDDIVSVEEIPVAVTPYGLVILCSSFSPFELVAFDASKVDADELEKSNNIVVNTDGNGKVIYNGKDAVGANGFIPVKAGENYTFTVQPKEGYTVDVVSVGGLSIPVENNEFTVNYSDLAGLNDVLNVSFVPAQLKQEEEEQGITSAVPNVVSDYEPHEHIYEQDSEKPATCGEAGYTVYKCTVCGRTFTQEIPATGEHTFTEDYDCTTADVCEICGKVVNQAMSHDFSGDAEATSDGHVFACVNPNCRAVSESVPHEGGNATCVSGGICDVCGYEYLPKDASNHTGGTEVRGKKEATFDEEGYTGDVYCLGCGELISAGQTVEKLTETHKHSYGEWQVDGDHHFRECACGETDGYGEHTYENGVCTVCGAKEKAPAAENTRPGSTVSPPTGEDIFLVFWLGALLTASVAAVVYLVVKNRKRAYRR